MIGQPSQFKQPDPHGVIGVVDYGVGNLTSVCNSLERIGVRFAVLRSAEEVAHYPKLLLPGVGAFSTAVVELRSRNLDHAIVESVQSQRAQVLGICLGMQLLYDSSSEGGRHAGLGLLPGTVEYLGEGHTDLRIPHMGWNSVRASRDSRLLAGCGQDPDFYFVHSYCCLARDRSVVTGSCIYGRDFDAVVEAGNVMGCQFHPEKSQRDGLRVLRNFAMLQC
jgi:glutamine amidotransferase